MRGLTITVITAATAALLMSVSDTSRADDEIVKPVQFGAGLMGEFGGNFLNKPDDVSTNPAGHTYPGFGGTSSGGGLMLEGRFIGLLGLEADILRSSDHGHGDLTINGYKFTITVGQSAWHVPVLAKLVAPLPVVRPMVFAGPEFVFPSTAEASVASSVPFGTQIAANAGSYTLFTGGVGIEFKLPLPNIDLRIPFTLRGGYNPSVKSKLDQRATYTVSGNTITAIDYKSEWKYQTYATLGVAAYF